MNSSVDNNSAFPSKLLVILTLLPNRLHSPAVILLHSIPFKIGPDCSLNVPSMESYWILPNVKPFSPSVSRASHKAVLHGRFMWVIGGYAFNYSTFQMVLK